MNKRFRRGEQIVYIPNHAGGLNHPDVEYGFVTSGPNRTGAYFCRFWFKSKPGEPLSHELRTKASSELTPGKNLYPYISRSQDEVESALKEYC